MTKVPSLGYVKVIKALKRDGWVVVRQKGAHIRLHKHVQNETLKLTIPGAPSNQKIHPFAHP